MPDEPAPNTPNAPRETVALFALFIGIAWLTYAFALTSPDSPPMLVHPIVAAALFAFLYPFRMNVAAGRGIKLTLVGVGYWIAAKMSFVWIPFVAAFLLAYLIRFVSIELKVIKLPGGRVIRLTKRQVNVTMTVGFVAFIALVVFVIVPSVISQAAQLATGGRVAYTKSFVFQTETLTLDDARRRVAAGGDPPLLARSISFNGHSHKVGEPLNDETLAQFAAAGLPVVAVQLPPLMTTWSEQIDWFQNVVADIDGFTNGQFSAQLQQRAGKLSEIAGRIVTWVISRSTQLVSGAVGFLAATVFTIIVLSYLMQAYDNYLNALLLLFPSDSWEQVQRVARGVDANLHAFLRGQTTITFIIAIVSTVAYSLAGIPFALVIGIAGGVLNLVPNFGPILAGVIGAVALMVGALAGPLPPILWFIEAPGLHGFLVRIALIPITLFLVQTIDNSMISPRIMSRAVNIDPLLVMFSVLAGGAIAGVAGVLLAIPSIVVIKSVWESYDTEHPASTIFTPTEPHPGDRRNLHDIFTDTYRDDQTQLEPDVDEDDDTVDQ